MDKSANPLERPRDFSDKTMFGIVLGILSLNEFKQGTTKFLKILFHVIIFDSLFISCGTTKEQNVLVEGKQIPLTDEQLLDSVQYYTFQYFWDGAESNSGMARERFHMDDPQNDKNVVTTGGTGFGLMGILAGIERGFISREEGLKRFQQIIGFLEKADRFHGVWPHWLNGETGTVQPFSPYDDGGDIVETAFLIQGLWQ